MMKVSVIHNNNQQPEQSEYVEIHYSEFPRLGQATLNEIKIINTLDYVESPDELISIAVSKLRYGGKLIVSGTDIILMSDKILSGQVGIDTIRNLLYSGRKSISYFEYIKNNMIQLGLKIRLINLDKDTNQYLIIGAKSDVD